MKKLFNLTLVRALALAVALLLCKGNIHAQVSVERIAGDISNQSIIRLLKPDVGIEYKHNGTTGTFNYVDFLNMTESRTVIPLMYNVRVSDFEIYNNDIVFFCGTMYMGSSRGCIGCFSVSDLENGTGFIRLFPFNECIDFRKMDVFSNFTNEVHVVAIADFIDQSNPYNIRGVYDVIFDVATWSVSNVAYNKYGGSLDYYEDIVCTDHYVATVEQKYMGNAEYTRVHSMPAFLSGDIFSPPTCSYYSAYGYTDFVPLNRERLITRMYGDYYATVCHVMYQTKYGLGISVYEATATGSVLIDRAFVTLGTTFDSNWEIKDFTYNHALKKFYALHNTNSTTPSSNIVDVDYSMGFYSVKYKHVTTSLLQSLSNSMLLNTEVVSGHISTTNEPLFVRIGPTPSTSCLPENPLNLNPVLEQNTLHDNGPDPDHEPSPLPVLIPITTLVYNLINICH